jgi:predicted nucleic acid-binding protein
LTLVLDANVMVGACVQVDGFAPFAGEELVGPPLLWSESLNALREGAFRGDMSQGLADAARRQLEEAPVRPRTPRGLRAEAWRIASEFGWAKTYDAEYLALASILGAPLITLDERLRRGAARLGFVMTPREWGRRR